MILNVSVLCYRVCSHCSPLQFRVEHLFCFSSNYIETPIAITSKYFCLFVKSVELYLGLQTAQTDYGYLFPWIFFFTLLVFIITAIITIIIIIWFVRKNVLNLHRTNWCTV